MTLMAVVVAFAVAAWILLALWTLY